jgi:hypothetical protein
MRLLVGMVLGAALTVGGAYLYDSQNAAGALSMPASVQAATHERPLVNWDVVAVKWRHITRRARAGWNRIAHSS